MIRCSSKTPTQITKLLNSYQADLPLYMLYQKKAQTAKKSKNPTIDKRISLEEDDLCSICHESMSTLQPLIYCKTGCGHNFHVHCFKRWAEHKNACKQEITCPLCRCCWSGNVMEDLRKATVSCERANKAHKIASIAAEKSFVCSTCNDEFLSCEDSRYICVSCHVCF